MTISIERESAGFAWLYPPYMWIPACAGMVGFLLSSA